MFWFAVCSLQFERAFIQFDVCLCNFLCIESFGAGVYNLECPKGGVKAIKVERRPTWMQAFSEWAFNLILHKTFLFSPLS